MSGFHAPIEESGLVEIVGINDAAIAQNAYSNSVEVAITPAGARPQSGLIKGIAVLCTEEGAGAVLTPNLDLILFDSNPNVTVADVSISAASWLAAFSKIDVATADFSADANGAFVFYPLEIPFHELNSIFVSLKNLDATAINSAAGDDEKIQFNLLYNLVS